MHAYFDFHISNATIPKKQVTSIRLVFTCAKDPYHTAALVEDNCSP